MRNSQFEYLTDIEINDILSLQIPSYSNWKFDFIKTVLVNNY